ncbi:Ribosomal protein L11 methyltransferase [Altererythrobacter epoxidivorans]|uniref:Ribosomal protein L11 methyltransferase n=1 Tax=Altererythrobacter epoxidivorans TaxID=361183 RepID=A0A0M3TA93_9SPHN|nr:50S ribosomal protein L11 methyltransferase [Altererythrobacter epoxidivorans]ALE16652.1 Ribosomal protein L11 methyltransferase [Altererythrobacter epoxidivorans]
MTSWKLTAFGPKLLIRDALVAQEDVIDWDPEIVLAGFEIADDKPEDWRLDAYLPRRPNAADKAAIRSLFEGEVPEFTVEKLPEADWVTQSQEGIEPIRAGRFNVHTPEFEPDPSPGIVNFAIPASQAFGTGQHQTTAGCLAMLDAMKASGFVARNIADIGTGTGLLAFAALNLWPFATATASDIDPVCTGVIEHNCELNGVRMGASAGELTMVIADGMADPLLQARGPYDLLIANILAGPLVELASNFAEATAPGGSVLLSGLLETQEPRVRRAYRVQGFRLAARLVNGDWSVLWLRKRRMR